MRMAKQIDSKNPRVHPAATIIDVTDANTQAMLMTENTVITKERDDNRITKAEAPMAIPAEPQAVLRWARKEGEMMNLFAPGHKQQTKT